MWLNTCTKIGKSNEKKKIFDEIFIVRRLLPRIFGNRGKMESVASEKEGVFGLGDDVDVDGFADDFH
jgi:hypothetical protein